MKDIYCVTDQTRTQLFSESQRSWLMMSCKQVLVFFHSYNSERYFNIKTNCHQCVHYPLLKGTNFNNCGTIIADVVSFGYAIHFSGVSYCTNMLKITCTDTLIVDRRCLRCRFVAADSARLTMMKTMVVVWCRYLI